MEDLASKTAYRAVVVFQLLKGEPLDALAAPGALWQVVNGTSSAA